MSDNFPMVLVGNKSDLEDDREVEAHKATKLARHWNDMPYYETSAKINLNLDEAFNDLGKQMLKRELDEEAANVGILPSLARKMPGRFPLRKSANRSRRIPWAGSV
jgi:GTPase SAR1 family protein